MSLKMSQNEEGKDGIKCVIFIWYFIPSSTLRKTFYNISLTFESGGGLLSRTVKGLRFLIH